jgi:hypothetical protein
VDKSFLQIIGYLNYGPLDAHLYYSYKSILSHLLKVLSASDDALKISGLRREVGTRNVDSYKPTLKGYSTTQGRSFGSTV